MVLADATVLTILSMAGRYNKPVQCGRESAHKSQAQGGLASLDIYMYGQQKNTFISAKKETISRA
jgi:hypothetical protein